MNLEAWLALYLAIIAPDYLTPDGAHVSLYHGRIILGRKKK